MSDDKEQSAGSDTGARAPYEAPKLAHIGNARELLAGQTGTQPDALPVPLKPQQAGT